MSYTPNPDFWSNGGSFPLTKKHLLWSYKQIKKLIYLLLLVKNIMGGEIDFMDTLYKTVDYLNNT